MRAVVLFLLCGAFATRGCCEETPLEAPVTGLSRSRSLTGNGRQSVAHNQQCAPFYSGCDNVATLCTIGSSCAATNAYTGTQCVPTVAARISCAHDALSCPDGWSCDAEMRQCVPSTSLLCYVGRASSASASTPLSEEVANDGDSDSVSAIEAIFGILITANGNGTDNNSTDNGTDSNSTDSGSDSDSMDNMSTVQPPQVPTAAPSNNATLAQSLAVALVAPVNGGVYSVHSGLPIEWTIRALDGGAQPLESFSVAFSADDRPFATVATNVRASDLVDSGGTVTVFRFDWDLNGDTSRLCAKCVLRVCGDVVSGGQQVCIRSDGGSPGTASSSQPTGVSFRIVLPAAVACACGLAHTPFVEYSYLVALCMPFIALLLQPLVTFDKDATVGDTRRPMCAYSAQSATRVGRVVLVLLLAAACLGSGFLASQVTEATFLDQTSDVALLWLGMFGLSLPIAFVYCTALWLAIFSVRWRREATAKDPVLQQRRPQQQLHHLDDPIMQSDRVVQSSDFVLTQQQQQHPNVGGIV